MSPAADPAGSEREPDPASANLAREVVNRSALRDRLQTPHRTTALTHEVDRRVTDRDDAVGTGQRVGGELGRAEQDHEGIGPHGTHGGAGQILRVAHLGAGRQLRRLPDCRRAAGKDDRPLTQQRRARLRKLGPELAPRPAPDGP